MVDEDEDAFKLAYTFLMTTRGIPQVYYGTELMQPMTDASGDGAKRPDMPGGWPDDARSVFTEEGRTAREEDAHDFVTTLTTWRETADVVHDGQLTQFIPQDNTYVYFRHDADDTVMVVLNNADESRELALERFEERLQGATSGRDVIGGRTYALDDTLAVPAKTPLRSGMAVFGLQTTTLICKHFRLRIHGGMQAHCCSAAPACASTASTALGMCGPKS